MYAASEYSIEDPMLRKQNKADSSPWRHLGVNGMQPASRHWTPQACGMSVRSGPDMSTVARNTLATPHRKRRRSDASSR